MPYDDAQARRELLDTLAVATDHLARALASLGAAYEQLDERQADQLEQQLFRPVQRAYGRAKRTYAEFASRHGLETRQLETPPAPAPSTGVRGFVEQALDAIGHAEQEIVALQDSLMPIEVGDVELRSGLSEVRQLLDGLSPRAQGFVRTFGR